MRSILRRLRAMTDEAAVAAAVSRSGPSEQSVTTVGLKATLALSAQLPAISAVNLTPSPGQDVRNRSRRHRRIPGRVSLRSKGAQCGPANEMPLGVEGVVDGGVDGQEPLG